MGDEVLTLATTGGRLWRAVRQPITAFLAELDGGPHECRLGGGTTLAARWRHRDSVDIDLTVSRGASLLSLGTDFERAMERLGGKVEFSVGRRKIDFGIGQVDLAQLDPCPARGQRTAVVDGEPFTVLSTAQILHGKLERATRSPVRDVFDIVKASRLDAQALAIALNCKSRLEAEMICLAWEKSSTAFEQVADEQLAGVPDRPGVRGQRARRTLPPQRNVRRAAPRGRPASRNSPATGRTALGERPAGSGTSGYRPAAPRPGPAALICMERPGALRHRRPLSSVGRR